MLRRMRIFSPWDLRHLRGGPAPDDGMVYDALANHGRYAPWMRQVVPALHGELPLVFSSVRHPLARFVSAYNYFMLPRHTGYTLHELLSLPTKHVAWNLTRHVSDSTNRQLFDGMCFDLGLEPGQRPTDPRAFSHVNFWMIAEV